MSRTLQAASLAVLLAVALPARAQQNTLRITTQPGSAQVYLDDAPKGTTSPDEGKLVLENLPAGSHKLRIGLSGYRDWLQSVTFTAGSTLYIDAKLTVAGPLPLTSQDVVDLLKGGVSAKRTADLVKERGVDFTLTEAIEQEIRAAGGDADLLLALTKAKAPPPPSPPPAVPPTITLLEPAGAENGKEIQVTGATLRVRGTASHPGGIASVSVNGQRAPARTLSPESVEFDMGDLPAGFGSTDFVILAAAVDHSELHLKLKVARAKPAPPIESERSAGPPPLTLEEVVTALRNDLPKDRIAALANQYGIDFEVTYSVDQRLRAVGADSSLLLALVKAYKGPTNVGSDGQTSERRPEVRILEPAPGSQTVKSSVRVRGVVTRFPEADSVEVAGIRATLRRHEDGSIEFEAENVPLSMGFNNLKGFVTSDSGLRESFTLEVTRLPLLR